MNAQSTILHELAGLLSGIWSFSEIVESRPDHPDRERFISLIRVEAKKAAQAMRDLQLLDALDRGKAGDTPSPVWLGELLRACASDSEYPAVFEELAEGIAGDEHPVLADPVLLSDVLVRIVDLAGENGGLDAPAGTAVYPERLQLRISCGPVEHQILAAGLERGEGAMRSLYLARRVLETWGGEVRAEPLASGSLAILELKPFRA